MCLLACWSMKEIVEPIPAFRYFSCFKNGKLRPIFRNSEFWTTPQLYYHAKGISEVNCEGLYAFLKKPKSYYDDFYIYATVWVWGLVQVGETWQMEKALRAEYMAIDTLLVPSTFYKKVAKIYGEICTVLDDPDEEYNSLMSP